MKYVKRTVAVVLFIVITVLVGKLLRYALTDDTKSFTRIMMHEFYNQENIDILFVGSSHCYQTFDTSVTDAIFAENTFTGGSSSQQMDGSYQLICEADREYDLKKVYLEVFYETAQKELYKDRTELTSTYILSDYMKPSFRKMKYLIDASPKEYLFNSFIVAKRNGDELVFPEYVGDILRKKQSTAYKTYDFAAVSSDADAYAGKGFIRSSGVIQKGCFYLQNDFTPIVTDEFSVDWRNSLMDIINYCKKHNIDLVMVSAPSPDFRNVSLGNYDDYIAYMNEISRETGVPYYDFNLCREEYFDATGENFKDTSHLNGNGAKAFSELFAKFFTGQISEEELFYSSYKEKAEAMEKMVFGVIYYDDPASLMMQINPVTNGDVNSVKIAAIKYIDGNAVDMRELSPGDLLYYNPGESGTFDIYASIGEKQWGPISVPYGK